MHLSSPLTHSRLTGPESGNLAHGAAQCPIQALITCRSGPKSARNPTQCLLREICRQARGPSRRCSVVSSGASIAADLRRSNLVNLLDIVNALLALQTRNCPDHTGGGSAHAVDAIQGRHQRMAPKLLRLFLLRGQVPGDFPEHL